MKPLIGCKSLLPFLIMAFLFLSCDSGNPSGTLEDAIGKIPNFTPIPDADNVSVKVTRNGNRSNFNVHVSNIGENAPIYDGTYLGWCADWELPIEQGREYGGITLYSTRDDRNWNKLNYLLNNRSRYFNIVEGVTWREIQAVIWTLIEYKDYNVNTDSDLNRDAYNKILNDVRRHGDAFRHEAGTIHAVFADLSGRETNTSRIQTLVIENTTAWAWAGKLNSIESLYSRTFRELRNKKYNGQNIANVNNRWGWFVFYKKGRWTEDVPLVTMLWAGAGQNEDSFGGGAIHVGNVELYDDGTDLYIVFKTFDYLVLTEIHAYAGDDYPNGLGFSNFQYPVDKNAGDGKEVIIKIPLGTFKFDFDDKYHKVGYDSRDFNGHLVIALHANPEGTLKP